MFQHSTTNWPKNFELSRQNWITRQMQVILCFAAIFFPSVRSESSPELQQQQSNAVPLDHNNDNYRLDIFVLLVVSEFNRCDVFVNIYIYVSDEHVPLMSFSFYIPFCHCYQFDFDCLYHRHHDLLTSDPDIKITYLTYSIQYMYIM